MSISGVTSAGSTLSVSANDFAQRKQHLDALESALNSGDINAAQSAFNTIQQDMQNMPRAGSSTQPIATTQVQSDFQKIGAALQSGDVNAAKAAFAAWQQDIQKMRGHHHHGGHRHQAVGQTDQAAQGAPTTPASNAPDTAAALSTFSATA